MPTLPCRAFRSPPRLASFLAGIFFLGQSIVAQLVPTSPTAQPSAIRGALLEPAVANTPSEPQFLAPTAVDFTVILPPPPTENSPADRADLQTVLNVQADRTPAQAARAERVAKQTVFSFAAPALGPWFNADNLPHTAAIFKVITAEEYAIATLAKRHFNRLRPMLKDAQVQSTTGRMRSTSYPSGHASDAATWAALLSEIFPERRDALAAQVRETMWGRVLAGAHYPSDTQAGQILGEAVAREMLKNPALVTALATVRAECEAAQAKSPAPPVAAAAATSPVTAQ